MVQWLKNNKKYTPISPYKIFLNDSNGHGCYFEKYLNNTYSITYKPSQIYVKTSI
jgi:hypothetical protein